MNRLFITIITAVMMLSFSSTIFADTGSGGHNAGHSSAAMDHSGSMNAEHDTHASGVKIHESHQGGYILEYRLIDMKEKMKTMKAQLDIQDTHHLMVFVRDAHGSVLKAAKVGYLIKDKASGTVQKKMTMAMNGGFGADVTFAQGNHYQIKTKVVAGSEKIVDEFKFMGGGH